jgi:hypothetical protein
MRLLVFLHGTTIMHPSGVGRTRVERVAQVRTGTEPGLHDYAAYVPIAGADLGARIKSIVVPEFGGIDHLPDAPEELRTFGE